MVHNLLFDIWTELWPFLLASITEKLDKYQLNKNKCNFKKVLVHVNMQHVRNVKDAWLRQIARLEFIPEDGAVASRGKNALFVRKLSIFCFKHVCRFDLIFFCIHFSLKDAAVKPNWKLFSEIVWETTTCLLMSAKFMDDF